MSIEPTNVDFTITPRHELSVVVREFMEFPLFRLLACSPNYFFLQ